MSNINSFDIHDFQRLFLPVEKKRRMKFSEGYITQQY